MPRGKPGRRAGVQSELTAQHVQFVAGIMAGKTQKQAAIDAGFGTQAGAKLMKQDKIKQEIARQADLMRQKTGYDAAAMMAELDKAIAFAEETENAGAMTKAIELKGKLHGLLIERVDQRQVASFTINIEGIEPPKPLVALPGPMAAIMAPLPQPVADKAALLAGLLDD